MKKLLHRLIRMDYLINLKSTGNPEAFGTRIGVSRRTICEYIRIMRELGAPIGYNRQRKTYFYINDGRFRVQFLDDDKMVNQN